MHFSPVETFGDDCSSGGFPDDSIDAESMTNGGAVFDNLPESSKLGVLHIDDEGLEQLGPSKADEDNDTVSSSSSNSGFFCVRIPVSPTSCISAVDPMADISTDSIDSDACFHPLSQINKDEDKGLARNSPGLVEPSFEIEVNCEQNAPIEKNKKDVSYAMLRITYLLVTLVIMLADGLQGTHLYVLYEGYGYSVAYLYCLGFAMGGLLSPITGPMVDKIGRKRSAMLYCCLEMLINYMEQYPNLYGLIFCRIIGGFTTNLLSSVFETWLDTEYRRRGFDKEKYEIIMRDSVIVSNLAAIFSGYLSHILAGRYGTTGPFQGAVTCTTIALIVVSVVWTENYGVGEKESSKHMVEYLKEAVTAFRQDRKMMTVGILQSLTTGSIQIFVFLWAPTLRHFAHGAPRNTWGLDQDGEPAYGLIFCAFMAAGVLGGLVTPYIRTLVTKVLSPMVDDTAPIAIIEVEGEGNVSIRPMAVEFLASACYFLSALLLFVPSVCEDGNTLSFTATLLALLTYEFLIGIFMPCEGVIRSLYFPATGRASIMTLPRIVVNIAVALGVVSTNFISLKTAFVAVGCMMAVSSALQISLISEREWSSLFSRFKLVQRQLTGKARSLSLTLSDVSSLGSMRRMSDVSELSVVGDTFTGPDMTLWDVPPSKVKGD